MKRGKWHNGDMMALRRELITLAAGLVLFIAAQIVLARVINDPKWLTLLCGIAPLAVVGITPLFKSCGRIAELRPLSYELLLVLAVTGAACAKSFIGAFIALAAYDIGSCLEHIFAQKNHARLSPLAFVRPQYATVLRRGETYRFAPEEINVGTVIVVRKNEIVALDGVVVGGSGTLDASIYGVKEPIEVSPGSRVVSGCVNSGDDDIAIRVTERWADSDICRATGAVLASQEDVSRREKKIGKVENIFFCAAIIAAIAIGIIPSIVNDDWTKYTSRAYVMLASASAAAPLVSIAMAYSAALSRAASLGILIKSKNIVDDTSRAATVVLDKTGTVTEGSFTVTGVEPKGISGADLITIAAAAETHSTHPIAHALRKACKTPIDPKNIRDETELPGRGVEAYVYGRRVLVGNSTLMESNGIQCPSTDRHLSVVHVSVAGVYYGYIIIDDRVKDGAKDAVRDLYALGMDKAVLLTGDTDRVGRAVGRALGVSDVVAGLSPDDKATAIGELEREKHSGKLIFAGDAETDGKALGKADVGIAMGALTPGAFRSRADIFVISDDIRALATAVSICKAAGKTVTRIAIITAAEKLLVMLMAALGAMSLPVAVCIDSAIFALTMIMAYMLHKAE